MKRHWDAWKKWYLIADLAHCRGLINAARHMKHFLWNSGDDLPVDYSQLISDVPLAKETRDLEINLAIDYAENRLWRDVYNNQGISSCSGTEGTTPKKESKDWFYAVNSHETWGIGVVSKNCDDYKMNILLKFEDKYNWDVGKSVEIFGFTVFDFELGTLHRVGLAQEFILKGEISYHVKWKKGERIGAGATITEGFQK